MNRHFSLRAFASTIALMSLNAFATSAASQATRTDVRDLPLNWTEPKGERAPFTAVMLTGDGGFADLDTKVTNRLAEYGIAVVGFNSRSWINAKRTPDETAVAVARALHAAVEKFGGDSILIVGYSRGADFAPFVANRLPADLRQKLSAVVMLGMAPAASFEFHLTDLIKDTVRPTDIPTMPELLKLQGTPMACVFGSEEKSSGCRGAPASLVHVEERSGGHHFDGDPKALADVVLRLIKRLPAK
ncbi:MAG: AcvB/VirJ family lysyl-phosphatidylglycerol hydrolase [Gemmatimonadaceae bacterium]